MIKIENKKTKNILYVCAAGLLIVAIIVNINLAKPNLNISSLTLGNLAFTEASGGGEASKGPTHHTNVHCHIERTELTYDNSNSASSFWGSLSAAIQAQIKAIYFNIGGNASANAAAGIQTTADYFTSIGYITVSTTTRDFDAVLYYCPNQDTSSCNPYDPCQ